jgi:hypothetical protein
MREEFRPVTDKQLTLDAVDPIDHTYAGSPLSPPTQGAGSSLPARFSTGATSRPERDHDASSGTGQIRSRGVGIVDDGATVSVAVVTSRTEAELIVGMLRSHGLRAAVAADDAGGQYPQLQMDGVRVMVPPSDEASARQLLAAADDAAGPVGSG